MYNYSCSQLLTLMHIITYKSFTILYTHILHNVLSILFSASTLVQAWYVLMSYTCLQWTGLIFKIDYPNKIIFCVKFSARMLVMYFEHKTAWRGIHLIEFEIVHHENGNMPSAIQYKSRI